MPKALTSPPTNAQAQAHPTIPFSRSSASSQIFLMAVFVSSLFSLGLNIYLSSKLGMLSDTHNLQAGMKATFTQPRVLPNNGDHGGIVSAAEHHGQQPDDANIPQQLQQQRSLNQHSLAGLSCDAFGGPSQEKAQEMVYWEDIPSDNKFVSPFKQKERQYLTFEPDDGGWNNIRMNMETVLALAFAMGRTLVLPPEKEFYLLSKTTAEHGGEQKKTFSFSNFFHMESIHNEHEGLDIITMTHYLETVAMQGKMLDRFKGSTVRFPPNNRTNWDGAKDKELKVLYAYLRETSHTVVWVPEDCMAAFPKSRRPDDERDLQQMVDSLLQDKAAMPKWEDFVGKPVPVDAEPLARLRENWAGRKKVCIYNNKVQQQVAVHFPTDAKLNARLLVHFYAFLYFQDWKFDLWMKRFVRDHVRYIDEIQCAAARVVDAVRQRARQRNPANVKGDFDTFHVRRGDFQYKVTRVDATVMYNISKSKLTEGGTLYIATDERDKSFFNPLKEHYDVVYLDDFADALGKQVNTNYYGMIDQLVASRGRVFFGCWFSTFTAYINRLRGYHADNHEEPGYKEGIINSWYYALEDRYDHHQRFYPVKQAFYAREFPTAWRLIDTGAESMLSSTT